MLKEMTFEEKCDALTADLLASGYTVDQIRNAVRKLAQEKKEEKKEDIPEYQNLRPLGEEFTL